MNIRISESMFDYTFLLYHGNTKDNSLNDKTHDCENSESLSSMYRAKAKILNYAKNNTFNYFFTQTFDDRKVDISEQVKLCRQLRQFFNNFKKRSDNKFRFILIAEYGSKNGRLHFHGLLNIENKSALEKCSSPKYGTYYRFQTLKERFGSSQLIPIKEYNLSCAYYVTKYITKSNLTSDFSSQYWCSRGLKTSKILYDFDNQMNYSDEKLSANKEWLSELLTYALDVGRVNHNPYCSVITVDKQYFPIVATKYAEKIRIAEKN